MVSPIARLTIYVESGDDEVDALASPVYLTVYGDQGNDKIYGSDLNDSLYADAADGLVGGNDVKAVVMYYGAPITDPAQLARLKAPVLGLFGGLDKGIPVDSVRAMERSLKAGGRTVSIHVYADANHAFANPTGQAYDKTAAEDAFAKTVAFFKANLK
jgi:dienelactone hydrolase